MSTFGRCMVLYNPAVILSIICVAFVLLPTFSVNANESCQLPPKQHTAIVLKQVHDGDTIILDDNSRLRLVGINAPELARPTQYATEQWHHKDQPLAQQAKSFLMHYIRSAQLTMVPAQEHTDRYGRLLAHVFAEGNNVTEAMLQQGMGFAVTLAPNTQLSSCYHQAEQQAAQARTGVWNEASYRPIRALRFADAGQTGFARIEGVVTKMTDTSSRIWIDIDDTVAIAIGKRSARYFDAAMLSALPGQRVRVRGWIIDRYKGKPLPEYVKRWMIVISHPAMLQVL